VSYRSQRSAALLDSPLDFSATSDSVAQQARGGITSD